MSRPTSRSLKIGALVLALTLVAAGCGRRGGLEAPPGGKAIAGEDNAEPETQSRATAGAIGNPLGQAQRKNEPIKPPSGPFVLDFLL